MPNRNIAAEILEFIRPIFSKSFGAFELFDIEFVKEGPNWYLRIYIDKDGGVTIDDCEAVSRAVEKSLDEHDPIEHAYILEVSSPGIDRPLKKDADYEKYRGKDVELRLYKPRNGAKVFRGALIGLEDGEIVVEIAGRQERFKKEDTAMCRLAI